MVAGMNDPVTASSVAVRREALRERATGHPAPPPELLAAAAVISVLTNEPAEVGADLAARALAGESAPPGSDGRPWFAFATWFSQATVSLLWAERYAQVRPLLDASIAQARATGDSSRLAVGLAHRGWLALRRGDLIAAEGDTRTALAAAELPAPTLYRVLNGGVLVKTLVEQGELDSAQQALAPVDSAAESGSIYAAVLRLARGRLRVQQGRVAEGLEDFLAVGLALTRALITCPSYLPWRSDAALAQLALGEHEPARRLADEELELARAFGAPRALGVAKRAAGLLPAVTMERPCSARRSTHSSGAMQDWRERAPSPTSAPSSGGAIGAPKRESLREALDAAHHAGAKPLARQAETELRATGARRAGSFSRDSTR